SPAKAGHYVFTGGFEMKRRMFAGVLALALGIVLNARLGSSQSQPPKEGPAAGATPAWFLQESFPDPTGRTIVDANGRVTVPPREGRGGRGAAGNAAAAPPAAGETPPPCRRSP